VYSLLNHPTATGLLESLIFWDDKRPIKKEVLKRIDLLAIFRLVKSSYFNDSAKSFGVDLPSCRESLAALIPADDVRTSQRRLVGV
jgi:hypothetical protein